MMERDVVTTDGVLPYNLLMEDYDKVKAMRDQVASVSGKPNNKFWKWFWTIMLLILAGYIISVVIKIFF